MPTKQKKRNASFGRVIKIFGLLIFGISLLGVGIFLSFQLSPWPSALIIRADFEMNATKTSEALEKYVPAGIASTLNQQYRKNDNDAYLDVYYPEKTDKVLPTIVWLHGGAWISGNKDQVANYLKILASHGYTVVSVGYSISPEYHFPRPLIQTNDALLYLQQNSQRLHIDGNTIVLAGDSAGAQIAAQTATVITNPDYAHLMGVTPAIKPEQLKSVVLACGAYDLSLVNLNGSYGDFLRTVLWSYSGERDFLSDPKFQQMSIINYVTKDYPQAFMTVGNVDPLESQSKAFAQKLRSSEVTVDTLFYSDNHEPKLPHEYQFNLDSADGRNALTSIVDFLARTAR